MSNLPVTPIVEMQIDGSWVDVTADVRLASADSGGGIAITRGMPNEGNAAEPTEIGFVLNNREGKYSPNNPYSQYYGLLGRNTPVRVSRSRQKDTFQRTEADSWGRLPTWVDSENKSILGERYSLTGGATRFDITTGAATIASGTGYSLATFGTYGDVEVKVKVKVSNLTSEFGIILRNQDIRVNTSGDFESGLGTWAAYGGTSTLVASTAQFHTGTTSALMTVGGSPTDAYARGSVTAVTPGHSYRARMWVRCSVTRTVTASIDWLDAGGGYLGGAYNGVSCTANTWTVIEVDGTAPDNAATASHGPNLGSSPTNGTLLFVDDVELMDSSLTAYYSAYITPGSPDLIRLGIVAPGGVATAAGQAQPTNVVADTWYWMKAQMTGFRRRVKFWAENDSEPRDWTYRAYEMASATYSAARPPNSGQVGVFAKDGSATVTFAEIEINEWRGHAEITTLPAKWDLSRTDRWVPINARGLLQRLGQGQKALESAVTLHLESYETNMWIPFEQFDASGRTIGNKVPGAPGAAINNVSQGSVDQSGTFAAPGLSGCLTLDQDSGFISARAVGVPSQSNIWSFLTFFRVPNTTAASCLLYSVETTGSAKVWRIWYTASSAVTVEALAADGSVIASSTANIYFSSIPQGAWLAANLYVFSAAGTVTWAWNFHWPGSEDFWSINGAFSGTAGIFVGAKATGSTTLTTAGGVQFAHWFHYPGDLPFVTNDFARAAYAYIGEGAVARYLRLGRNAGIKVTTYGQSGSSKTMGPQTPARLLDLLNECAGVDDAMLIEDRSDLGLDIRTRESLYNQRVLNLNIDDGHLSDPLDPNLDDQRTRNDVTVSRPNGGSARSIQTEGPLNINDPEDDVDGVGVYDEAPEINYEADTDLQAAANWRRSKGTIPDPRYPSIRVDLAARAYEADAHLTAQALAKDSGDVVSILNTEVGYNRVEQLIQGYTELIDQYDHQLTWVGVPAAVRRVGNVQRTTRLATRYQNTGASFVAGTDTLLTATRTSPGSLWVKVSDSPESFPFVIEAGGVQLRVTATGQVLNANPYFDSGITGYSSWVSAGAVALYWDRYSGNYVVSPGSTTPGSVRMTATGATTGGCVADSGSQAAVSAATDYQVSGWVKSDVGLSDVRITADWYQSNGTFISTSSPTQIATSAGVWVHYAAVLTSPALSAFARIKVRAVLADTNQIWADDLRLMPVSSYSTSPQTLTVDQVPVNGVVKTIPSGSKITVVDPWRLAF